MAELDTIPIISKKNQGNKFESALSLITVI